MVQNAFELELALRSRLHSHLGSIIHNFIGSSVPRDILNQIRSAVYYELIDMCSSRVIPSTCIKGGVENWCANLSGHISVSVSTHDLTLDVSVRTLCEIAMTGYIPYNRRSQQVPPVTNIVPTSDFLRMLRTAQEHHRMRNLFSTSKELFWSKYYLPKEGYNLGMAEARAKMASELQTFLKKEEEEQRLKDKEEAEIRELGFQRMIDLD